LADATGLLSVSDDGTVRTITFDRPAARNALTTAMRAELCGLLAAADADPGVRAVILTGRDPAFTGGVDFKEVSAVSSGPPSRFAENPGRVLRAMTTPVIAAVNGACVSGGLEIALSAAFAVASERAVFADTHAQLNAVPTWGLTALLPRAVGVRKAREMSLTGARIGADEALRIGLVNHVVDHERLLDVCRELAGRIAPTPAAGEVMALYAEGSDLGLSAALHLETVRTSGRQFDPDAFTAAGRAVVGGHRESTPT
jgi:enoyl-CoA hydratase